MPQGRPDGAKRLNREITDLLSQAKAPQDQQAYLLALGNAGLESNIPLALGYANSESFRVRMAAARALRKTQTPKAAEALLGLCGDKNADVQKTALSVMRKYALNSSELTKVNQLLESDRIDQSNYGVVASILGDRFRENSDLDGPSRRLLAELVSKDLSPKLRYALTQMATQLK